MNRFKAYTDFDKGKEKWFGSSTYLENRIVWGKKLSKFHNFYSDQFNVLLDIFSLGDRLEEIAPL